MNHPSADKQTGVMLAACGALPVAWAALLVAPFLSEGLVGIVQGFTSGMADPIKIQWCADSPKTLLLFLLAYGLLNDELTTLLDAQLDPSNDSPGDEERLRAIATEMQQLRTALREQQQRQQAQANGDARLQEIFDILDAMPAELGEYDDLLVKRIVQRVTVRDANTLTILFEGGYSIEANMAE